MTILEYLNTPADLYHMALECGHAWDEGYKEAQAAMRKGDELKGGAQPGPARPPIRPRMPWKPR